ncbi:hypothetical protein GCM10009566_68320 [Streptomyces murinus]
MPGARPPLGRRTPGMSFRANEARGCGPRWDPRRKDVFEAIRGSPLTAPALLVDGHDHSRGLGQPPLSAAVQVSHSIRRAARGLVARPWQSKQFIADGRPGERHEGMNHGDMNTDANTNTSQQGFVARRVRGGGSQRGRAPVPPEGMRS